MSQYTWATCPDTVRTQIDTLLDALQEILGENLVGVYLHGSLAMGSFNSERSDIDLLVVTKQGMTVEIKRRIAELLLDHSLVSTPKEISFLIEPDLRSYQHPMPFDFHYSESWRKRYQKELSNGDWMKWNDTLRKDVDLAAHFTVTLSRGICLFGKPIQEVFPPVPAEYYIASIVRDFQDARDRRTQNPVYFVLNACRIYAYLLEGSIFSKDEGPMWAVRVLPGELRDVVTQALDVYRGNSKDETFDEGTLAKFATYMDEQVKMLN